MFEDRIAIGKLLKRRRLELDLTLKALEDKNISASTISMIERGSDGVTKEKVLYLCSLLNVNLQEEMPDAIKEDHQREQALLSKLEKIETTIDLINPKKGLKRINFLLKNTDHNLSDKSLAFMHYLKGRAYMNQAKLDLKERNLERSERNLKTTLQIIEKSPELTNTNIQALAYHELGRLYYYKNQFTNALTCVEKGITSFIEEGSRKYIRYPLRVSKAIYLEKLDRLFESLKILEVLWEEIDYIKNIQVILNMCEVRSAILKKFDRYDEAISFCNEGIEIARTNLNHERSFELWVVRGSIFSQIGDLNEAKESLLTALEHEEFITNKYLFISAYTELGQLYLKQELYDDAIHYLQKAISIGEATNDSRRLSQALLILGDCYFNQNLRKQAVHYYKQSYDIAFAHNFQRLLRDTLLQLVQCREELTTPDYNKFIDQLIKVEVELKLQNKLA